MKNKFIPIILFCLVFLPFISAEYICRTYDSFDNGLDLSKWEISQHPEGQHLAGYGIDETMDVFYIYQNGSNDFFQNRTYLIPKYQFSNKDVFEYDVNYISGEGNRISNFLIKKYDGSNFKEIFSLGYWNGESENNEFGIYHVKLNFSYPDLYFYLNGEEEEVFNLSESSQKMFIGSAFGNNSLGRFEYDNFTLCKEYTVNAKTPDCPIEKEILNIYVNISTESCIDDILMSVKIGETWKNFSASVPNNGFGDYSIQINPDLTESGDTELKIYLIDCNGEVYSKDLESFYIYPKTKLTIMPSEPNGKNNWYITNPVFSLENENASVIYYKWDSQDILEYSETFGFENAPNNQNMTGGIIDLNYWSELVSCDREEETTSRLIRSDLTNPVIKDLIPGEGEKINNLNPKISAYLDEVYGSNSGINTSSIVLKVDNVIVNPVIIKKGLDALVEYTPQEKLSEGEHNISIYVEDNAGRFSEEFWKFNIKFSDIEFDLNVTSPKPELYGVSKIPFNITTTKNVKSIEYRDLKSTRTTWTRLCTNCSNYGNSAIKIKTLADGAHEISIRATSYDEIVKEETISLIVDSKAPKFYSTSPKINKFTDGSDFYVKFIEDNTKEVELIINKTNSYEVTECYKTGKYTECYADVDLSEFEGKEIEYFFKVSDDLRTASSRPVKVKVDSLFPEIEVVSPENGEEYNRKVNFEIKVNESNLNSVSYAYEYQGKERKYILCTRLTNGMCNVTKSLFPGNYSVVINVEDKAGNLVGTTLDFKVK